MPPCGCAWLANPHAALIAGLVAGTIVACHALVVALPAWAASLGIAAVLIAALVVGRRLVALLVRSAVARGVAACERRIAPPPPVLRPWRGRKNNTRRPSSDDDDDDELAAEGGPQRSAVGLVVGFSWGGGVAHALLAKRTAWTGPTLLLAPTVLAMAAAAQQRPPAIDRGSSALAVVAADFDDFCPAPATADLYESAYGCNRVHRVRDNHVLLAPQTTDLIARLAGELLASSLAPASSSPSEGRLIRGESS
mmetsp:Transcript_16914/g.68216  ORF Transcript_16914/g.68216 Transcript_16914/m.68216 type:complete len:252 (+) Transcript_16914:262-1017(+)